jgi:hypothetical protein
VLTPTGKVRVPLAAWKSDGVVAVPGAVAYETVTGASGLPESETTKVKAVVPLLPSLPWASEIPMLHSNRRSCRWFLSPHPLPGFVIVGVVVLVEVEVEVDVLVLVLVEVEVEVVVGVVVVVVDVEVLVVVGVVVVVVLVEVVVGVVVVVVEVVVEVEYWSAPAELRAVEEAYPSPPSPTRGTVTATVAIATTMIRRRRSLGCLILPVSPHYEHRASARWCQSRVSELSSRCK